MDLLGMFPRGGRVSIGRAWLEAGTGEQVEVSGGHHWRPLSALFASQGL